MDKQKIQDRINKLTQEQAAMNAAYQGAIQEANHWLASLEPKEEVKPEIN